MRHPTEEMLIDHAAGQMSAGERLLIEAHLHFCPACRGEVSRLLQPGQALLERGRETIPAGAWQQLRARVQAEGRSLEPTSHRDPLPLAARLELRHPDRPIRLRPIPLTGGARYARLDVEAAEGDEVLVLAAPGGLTFPRHLHLGIEDAVVLCGGYEDERGEFEAGDFERYEPGSEHGPTTEPGETCWIVTRVEGGVLFRGWRGVLQRLMGRF